jgi:hypothetical protein
MEKSKYKVGDEIYCFYMDKVLKGKVIESNFSPILKDFLYRIDIKLENFSAINQIYNENSIWPTLIELKEHFQHEINLRERMENQEILENGGCKEKDAVKCLECPKLSKIGSWKNALLCTLDNIVIELNIKRKDK